jgi:hypothetical protein
MSRGGRGDSVAKRCLAPERFASADTDLTDRRTDG